MPIPSRGTGAGGGGGGASALTDLTDTPDAIFPADAGKAVIVKRDSTGFEFDDLANDGYYKLGPTPNRFESETERNTQAHDRANEAWLNEYVNDATSVIRLVDTTANTVTIQAEPTVTNTDNTVFGATAPLDVEDVRAVYGLQDSADGKYYITFDNNGDATKLKNLIEGKNQADRIILKDTADNQEVELVSAEIIRQRSQQTVFAKTVTHTTSTGPVTTTIAAQSVVTAISLFDEQDPDDSTRNIFKVRLTMGTGTTGRSNAEGFVTVVDAIIKNLVPSDNLRPARIKFSQGSGGNEISHDLQISAIISENSTASGTTTYFAVLTIGGIHTSTAGAPASGTAINTGWDITANFHNNDWRVIFTVEGTEQSPFATVPGPSQWDIVDRDISVAWKNISGAGVGNTVFTDDTLTGDGATAATALSVVRQPPAQGDPMQGPEIETFRLASSTTGLNPNGNGRWSRISDNEIRVVERNAGMVSQFRAATHVWFNGRRYPIAFADRTRANTYEIVLTGVVFPTSGNLTFYEDAEAISDKNLEGLGGEDNVQADWSETDSTDDAFIQNKPTIPSSFSDLTGQVADSQIPASIARDSEITDAIDDLKGSGLPAGRDTLKELSDAIDGISGGDSGIVRVAASTSYDAAETAALNGKIIIAQSIINNIVLTFTAPTTVTDQGFIVHHITEESGTAKVQLRAATGSTSFPASGHDIEPNESGVVAWDQSDGRFEFHAFNAPSSSSGGLTESAAKALIENFAEVGAAGTIPLARFGDGIITEAKLATAVTTKLNEGEDNVQADWSETRTGNDAFIKNKPTIPAAFSDLTGTVSDSQIPASIARDSEVTAAISGLSLGEDNVQADWDETSTTSDAFIKNKPTIPSAFSDLTGSVADSQIPASIARDTEITSAINALKGSGLAAGRDTLKELSDAIDAAASTGGISESDAKALIENFAEVGATGTIPLARFGDGVITAAKLASAVSALLLPTFPTAGDRNDKVPKFNGDTLGWEVDAIGTSSSGLDESAVKALIENFAEVGASGTVPLARFGDGIITEAKLATAVRTKLNEGEDNVQADWSETDTSDDSFIQNKPTIPSSFSDLSGSVADSQIPASIARDTEITTAINNLKGSGLAAGRDTLKELSDAIDAAASTGGLTETAVKNLIENFAEVGATGTIPLARFGDGIITEAKLASAVTTKLNEGEDNVQADWSETRTGNDAFIKNKPTIPSAFSDLSGSVADGQIPASIARDTEVTAAIDALKGSGLAAGRDTLKELSDAIDAVSAGDDNVQSDWNEADSTDDAFIKNKPTALLLPALPSIGDRNDKVPKFSGDTLGWELDAATSNRSDIQFNERGTTTWSRADLLSYDNLYILWQGSAAATWTFPNLRSGDGITFVVRNIESSRLTVSYTGLSSNLHIDRWDKVIFQWDGTTWSHEELNLSQVLTDAEIESNSLKITRLDGTTETSSLPAGGGGSKVAWIDSNQSYNAAQTLALDDHTIYCYPTSDITISLAALQSTQNAQLLIHNVGRGNGTDVTVSAAATNSANNVSNWRILQRSLTVFTWLTDRWYTFDMPFHSMITRARLNASNSKILELGTVTDADAWTLTLPIPDKATDAEARAGTDDSDYMTAAKVKEAIDHYLGQSAGPNDVYWGGLAADPTSITQTPALQSEDIPTNGIQTLTVARTWSGANRHMYVIQPAADDDISAFTLNGNPSTGWTGPTTFTEGGTQYEFWKSQYAWGSATAQGIRIGLTR